MALDDGIEAGVYSAAQEANTERAALAGEPCLLQVYMGNSPVLWGYLIFHRNVGVQLGF